MSDQPPVILSEMELDALTELVNLGVSKAAMALRAMVQDEVHLSVPTLSIVSRELAIASLQQQEVNRLVAVHQNFEGAICGRALLIFPETQSIELVRAVVGGDLSHEDLMELEQEALAETGNVLLNSCLGTIANNLERSLRISLPEVVHGDGSDVLGLKSQPHIGDNVLFIHIKFTVRRHAIESYIAMLLDLASIVTLKELLAGYIDRMGITTTISPDVS